MSIQSPARTPGERLGGPAGERCLDDPPERGVADRLWSRIGAGFEAILDTWVAWRRRRIDRRRLQQMDDHMLKDIGLSRADVEAEISKPFWIP